MMLGFYLSSFPPQLNAGHPKIDVSFADVRNVAEAHLKALVIDGGNQHIVPTQSVWMKQVAQVLQELKPKGFCISTVSAPNFLIWLGAFFQRNLQAFVPKLGREFITTIKE